LHRKAIEAGFLLACKHRLRFTARLPLPNQFHTSFASSSYLLNRNFCRKETQVLSHSKDAVDRWDTSKLITTGAILRSFFFLLLHKIFLMTIEEIIQQALIEDIGAGDQTSLAVIPKNVLGSAQLVMKENGVIFGIEIARKVFQAIDSKLVVEALIEDGTHVKRGDIVFSVSGRSVSILSGERVALNFLQRLSGIATATRLMVDQLEGSNTRLLDTRKTTPLLRELEKMAVRAGGGYNHRMGLYDMIMIKDNHVDFAGGVKPAIEAVHRYLEAHSLPLKIEIEIRNSDELEQVLEHGGVDRIMLDNFLPDDLKTAVDRIAGLYETEASGNINIANIRQFAATGVDFISSGALTHQIKSLDMSLKVVKH
jgi:nicotinate-nucleotide pyrophosphorylase (carboxylating)